MKILKRILAIAGIVIIAGLYITTLILAIIGGETAGRFLIAAIVATVVIPCLMYIINWLGKLLSGRDE